MNDYAAVRDRWQTPAGRALAEQVWVRLVAGIPLDDLGLESVDGRVDLRGIVAPAPTVSGPDKTYRVQIGAIDVPGIGRVTPDELTFETATVENLTDFRDVQLRNLDFRGSHLAHLRFFQSMVTNCRFDDADCRKLGFWGCEVADCSFVGANLAGAVLGGQNEGRHNRYDRIDFRRADLTDINCGSPDFTDVDFRFAKLRNVDFKQTNFVRCQFAGTLKSVIFDGRILSLQKKADPNPMEDIDMSGVTSFDGVDFRAINFDRVILPDNPNLIVVRDPEWVKWAVEQLADTGDDLPTRIVRAVLEQSLTLRRDGAHELIDLAFFDQEPPAGDLVRELLAKRRPN